MAIISQEKGYRRKAGQRWSLHRTESLASSGMRNPMKVRYVPSYVGSQEKSYTFADYFELNYPTEDIVGELG
jgi:hypothetical protein